MIATNLAGIPEKPAQASTVLTIKRGGGASGLHVQCLHRVDRRQAARTAEIVAALFQKVMIQVCKYECLVHEGLSLKQKKKYNGPKQWHKTRSNEGAHGKYLWNIAQAISHYFTRKSCTLFGGKTFRIAFLPTLRFASNGADGSIDLLLNIWAGFCSSLRALVWGHGSDGTKYGDPDATRGSSVLSSSPVVYHVVFVEAIAQNWNRANHPHFLIDVQFDVLHCVRSF